MWVIILAWLTIPFQPIIADGTYATKHDCESFVEFIIALDDAPYTKENGVYTIEEVDGRTFVAECIHLDETAEK